MSLPPPYSFIRPRIWPKQWTAFTCYDWVSCEDLEGSAVGLLLDAGVPNDIIYSGHIDLRGYKAHQLETCGYMKASGDIGYIVRNTLEFLYEHSTPGDNIMSQPEQGGMTMQ